MIPFLECELASSKTVYDLPKLEAAIAIYKPPDVRPILEAYAGKNIPIEYGKKEAEAKAKHVEEWQKKKGVTGGSFGSLFGLQSSVRISSIYPAFILIWFLQ